MEHDVEQQDAGHGSPSTYALRMVRRTPANERLRVLARPDVIAALGASTVVRLRHEAKSSIARAQRNGCSGPWVDAILATGMDALPKGMSLGHANVAFGGGIPSRRPTPRIALDLENQLDAMSPADAAFYWYPPSPSAETFKRAEERGGRLTPGAQLRHASTREARRLRGR